MSGRAQEGTVERILRSRWSVVCASVCGLMVGSGPVLIFSSGVFLKPVSTDLGITRGDLSSAVFLAATSTAIGSPIVGWLLDRFGTRRVMITGIPLFALVVAGFGLMQAKPPFIVPLIFALVGLTGAVQTPIPYALVVARWFDRQRGLALGIATAGVGLGTALLPPFLALLIDEFGWRQAYFGLGLSVLVLAWLPVALFVREPSERQSENARENGDLGETLPGMTASAAFRRWEFWALTVAFFLGVMAINGTLTHVVPLLTDRGIAASQAAVMFSFAGAAIIGGRILAGWCLDRLWGPYVAILFFAIPMIGIALLGSGIGGVVPFIGAICCGAGIGAEIDMMAFFVSRYFGIKAYGKIYGVMAMAFNIGTGLGPALSGLSFDRFHSYGPIFLAYELALGVTCALFLRLGPYPYPAADQQKAPGSQLRAAA